MGMCHLRHVAVEMLAICAESAVDGAKTVYAGIVRTLERAYP